ncbi:MAG: endonuclease/exonuclease/phosphatase family protein [Bacteroidales bacterium]
MSKKKKSIIARLLIIINFFLALGLLISASSPIIPPKSIFNVISVVGIAFPVLAICNIFCALCWLITKPKYALVSFIALIISSNVFFNHFRFIPAKEKNIKGSIHLMSYNVRNFVSTNKKRILNKDEIGKFLKEQSPDILCMQEFGPKAGKDNIISDFKKDINARQYFFNNYYPKTKGSPGLIIFSKHPIIDYGSVSDYKKRVFTIYTDIVIQKKDTIRVFDTHLESIRLQPKETEFFINVNSKSKEELKKEPKVIVRKIRNAYGNRIEQVNILKKKISESPYPCFVCGDFNDTPSSWAYYQIKKSLKDGFTNAGFGTGITYNGSLPLLRIDYIFTPKNAIIQKVKSHRINYSDHYPQSSWVEIKKAG